MEQMEAAVRVACRWCGFFSKPASACDVCGSPLPSNAPTVPLEVARAAVFSRAEPISVVDEPVDAADPPDPPPSTAWERLLGVIGEPDDPAPPRRRIVIELDELDQSDGAFADEALYEDGSESLRDPGVDAFLDELAVGTVLADPTADVSVESGAAAAPAVGPAFIEFDAADGAGGALFGAEWHPRRAPRPAPAWSEAAPVFRPRRVRVDPVPAWASSSSPVRARDTTEPLVPAWSIGAVPRPRVAERRMPVPAWSHPSSPTVDRSAATFIPAWASVASPSLPRQAVEPAVPPAPAWGSASMPVRARPVSLPPAPAWASAGTPTRPRPAPLVVLPAWSDPATPGRPPTPARANPQPVASPITLSRVQVGEELAALSTEPAEEDAPAPVRAVSRAVAEPAPAGRRLGFLRRGAREADVSPPVPTRPRAESPQTVEGPPPQAPPVTGTAEPASTVPDPPAPGDASPTPSADAGKTCSRCGRLSDRALCEACRDALQELHALSLG